MINPTCDYCSNELNEMGAILLSPPDKDLMVKKFHICVNCYPKMVPQPKLPKTFTVTRCCGRCDGVDDICVADMTCKEHNEMGCELCYGPRQTVHHVSLPTSWCVKNDGSEEFNVVIDYLNLMDGYRWKGTCNGLYYGKGFNLVGDYIYRLGSREQFDVELSIGEFKRLTKI